MADNKLPYRFILLYTFMYEYVNSEELLTVLKIIPYVMLSFDRRFILYRKRNESFIILICLICFIIPFPSRAYSCYVKSEGAKIYSLT